MIRRALLLAAALLLAGPAYAYELFLDIDTDDDPTTINDFTWDTTVTVRLVLAPTETDEEIWAVDFGLGGSCHDCLGVFSYGTGQDLGDMQTWTWDPHPYFAGTWQSATSLNCPAPTGFHNAYHAESIIDCCFVLEEPIFFGTFTAWAADHGPGCHVPPNLAVMHGQGVESVWHYIQIGEPAVDGERTSWGTLKAAYR